MKSTKISQRREIVINVHKLMYNNSYERIKEEYFSHPGFFKIYFTHLKFTILHLAIYEGRTELVKLILAHHNPDEQKILLMNLDINHNPPAFVAILQDDVEILKLLSFYSEWNMKEAYEFGVAQESIQCIEFLRGIECNKNREEPIIQNKECKGSPSKVIKEEEWEAEGDKESDHLETIRTIKSGEYKQTVNLNQPPLLPILNDPEQSNSWSKKENGKPSEKESYFSHNFQSNNKEKVEIMKVEEVLMSEEMNLGAGVCSIETFGEKKNKDGEVELGNKLSSKGETDGIDDGGRNLNPFPPLTRGSTLKLPIGFVAEKAPIEHRLNYPQPQYTLNIMSIVDKHIVDNNLYASGDQVDKEGEYEPHSFNSFYEEEEIL